MEEATFTRPAPFASLHDVLDALVTASRSWLVEILLEITYTKTEPRIPRSYAVFMESFSSAPITTKP